MEAENSSKKSNGRHFLGVLTPEFKYEILVYCTKWPKWFEREMSPGLQFHYTGHSNKTNTYIGAAVKG